MAARKSNYFAKYMGCLMLAFASPAIGQPRVPATAVGMVLEYQGAAGRNDLMKFLWSPAASDDEYATACVAIQTSLNQSSTPYHPPRLMGGALIGVDLTQLADTQEQLDRIVKLWDSLTIDEPYFTFTQRSVIHGDPKKKSVDHVEAVVAAAPHLGEEAYYVGVGRVYRVDQFARRMLSSIEDGKYYEARGLVVGKTKLRPYLKSRGFDLDAAQLGGAIDQLLMLSNVTGNVRVIKLGQSEAVKPSKGRGLVSLSNDLSDGPNDPNKNGFQSLLNEKFAAYKCIVTLPTGQQEFTLFNSKEELIAEADPHVATDSKTPPPFHAILYPAFGCIRCHGPSEGLQPLTSQFSFDSQGFGRVLADLSRGTKTTDQFKAYQTIRSRYGATQTEVDHLLQDGRDSLARQYDFVNLKEPHGAKAAYEATARTINRYWYRWMNPIDVCQELGIDPGHDPVGAFNTAIPAAGELIPTGDAGITNRIRNGHEITRQEFEQVFVQLETQAMSTIMPQQMQKGT